LGKCDNIAFPMLTIAVPKSMETTLDHLGRAGRPVVFEEGRDVGFTSTGDEVVQVRSYDIPLLVGVTAHVGMCGSDVVEERKYQFLKRPEILSEFGYGRTYYEKPPTLDLVARQSEYVPRIEEIPSGSIILTELPNLTREKFEQAGRKVEGFLEGGPEDLKEFIEGCKRSESVGVVVVHGKIPGMLEHLNGYQVYGVMVNETGRTLRANRLRVVKRLQTIRTLLIADKDKLQDEITSSEIDSLVMDMNEAERIRINREFEASGKVSAEGSLGGGPLSGERVL